MTNDDSHGAFSHLLLTRFGVQLPGRAAPSEPWLAERLALFRRYTIPSINAQTDTRFQWVIYCDAPATEWLLAKVSGEIRVPMEIVAVAGEWTASIAAESARPHIVGETLLTTRVDSDDALASTFVSAIHRIDWGTRNCVINFTDGLQLSGNRLYKRSDPSNAFVTLVERVDPSIPPITVYAYEHQQWIGRLPTLQLPRTGMWLQTVHGNNVANRVAGLRAGRRALLNNFGSVELNVREPSTLAVIGSAVRLIARTASRPHRIVWAVRVVLARLRPVARRLPRDVFAR